MADDHVRTRLRRSHKFAVKDDAVPEQRSREFGQHRDALTDSSPRECPDIDVSVDV